MNDKTLSLSCHWYAQIAGIFVPIGYENDSKQQRPDFVHT